MLDRLQPQAVDGILQLMRLFREDQRAGKIDLGVGVYRDATGATPVMRAVKAAEKRLWKTETTKTYTGLAGEPAFNDAMRRLILGDAVAGDRLASIATPGGTGILIAVAPEASTQDSVQGNLNHLNRQNFSFPPDHGARLVTMALEDAALAADWRAELEDVRLSMRSLRRSLAEALRTATNFDQFDFVGGHRGMFSRLGLTADQVMALRTDHAIYMGGDSRINVAGVNEATVPVLARAVAQVAGG